MDTPQDTLPLFEHDIVELVGPTYFERGEDYWRRGKVYSVKHIPERRCIKAYVAGSGRKRYTQDIDYDFDGDALYLDSECSCPVQFDCKHVAAALLALIHRQGAQAAARPIEPEVALRRWLEAFEAPRSGAQTAPRASNEQVLYLLDSPVPGRVGVHAVRARRLKQGGWGKPSPVSPYDFLGPGFVPYWCDEEDARLCNLVFGQIGRSGGGLKGATGAFILRQLLSTGRCFWRTPDAPPLQADRRRPLQASWRKKDGHHHLELTLPEVEYWIPVDTDPPCYVDTANHRAGPIESDLDGETLAHLVTLPPVPPAEAEPLSRFLRLRLPAARLPLPVKLNETVVDEPPKPDLHLTVSRHSGAPEPTADLGFLYGAHRLTGPGSEHTVVEAGRSLTTVRRDTAAETAAARRLHDLGLAPAADNGRPVDHPLQFVSPRTTAAERIEHWLALIESDLPALAREGWEVRFDEDFDLGVTDAAPEIEVSDGDRAGWFEMSLRVDIDGRKLPLAPLLAGYLKRYRPDRSQKTLLVPVDEDRWLRLPADSVRPMIDTLLELFDDKHKTGQKLKLPNSQATLLNNLDENTLHWRDADGVRALSRQLKNFKGIRRLTLPKRLRAKLRPYQRRGLDWLGFLREYSFGGILADDMGLGKTLQTLAFLLREKQQGRLEHPALVVAPTSLLWNWEKEAARFTPDLRVTILHGLNRDKRFKRLREHDLAVTTYALLPRDTERYNKRRFSVVVLDEAQQVKNPRSKAAQCARQLKTETRICLTGTPMENHLGELWALMDFTLPGLLGGDAFFKRHFRTPIEKHADEQRRDELRRRVAPFILRRDKAEVVAELPPKSEIAQSIELDNAQRTLYETVRAGMEKKIRRLLREKGLAKSQIEFLDALLKLRQACCDARLVKTGGAKKTAGPGAKLVWLKDNLPEMIEEGRRILLFSQFTTMLSLIRAELDALQLPYEVLTGRTRNRRQAVDRFQNGEVPLFLVSLKAGGSGLNLTAADVVIHYDPWWNPAVERQATDRAYRIGQDKPVFVYKLIARDTVEEKIQQLQQNKQHLADALFDAKRQNVWQGDADELLALFS